MVTPGSPLALSSSPETRDRSPSPQTFEHLVELEAQILRNEQQFRELHSVYDRFVTLLPIELSSSDHNQLSLSDQFRNLFEQWSTYVDTLSITQQELDSIKQLLIEKQDDLEKLQADLDLTTSKLIELQQEQPSLIHGNKSFQHNNEENEDEIENIFELHQFPQRAPSRQSLISSTPGEKQQLIAQNELLSSLLAEKDRELISLQQAEKTREDLIKNLETLKMNLQQIELDKELKQVEFNDIRNVLDEKLRENSSLKKEKMYFIEKLSEMERDRQEQPSMTQITRKQSAQEDEKSSTPSTPTIKEDQNVRHSNRFFISMNLFSKISARSNSYQRTIRKTSFRIRSIS
jgi:chromosome segregation ATPase